jgi:hypothetical protein
MTRRSKVLSVVFAGCALVSAGLGWRAWRATDSDARLFDTDALVVEGLTWHGGPGGCTVQGTLVNRDPRTAVSVIVVLELRDPDGSVVATNPMVEVLHVPGQGEKAFAGGLRVPRVAKDARVTARVAAVRWE